MASSYSKPQDYIRYLKRGKQLGLVTALTESDDNSWETIDESQAAGLLYEYISDQSNDLIDRTEAAIEDETLPVNPRVHGALLDWVISRLYLDKPNKTEDDRRNYKLHYGLFNKNAHRRQGGQPKRSSKTIKVTGVTALK